MRSPGPISPAVLCDLYGSVMPRICHMHQIDTCLCCTRPLKPPRHGLITIKVRSAANSLAQKLYNWSTLNNRVFKRLGFVVANSECALQAAASSRTPCKTMTRAYTTSRG